MVLRTQLVTAEQFDELMQRPDRGDTIYELISGEIVEVPSNAYASNIAQLIGFFIRLFIREKGIAGFVTGADGGYQVAGERYAPDVAYISKARQPELAREGYNPNPPELAVEVISDETNLEEQRHLRRKITNYLAAGTIVWVVLPVSQMVEVHTPGQPLKTLYADDTLDGGDVLPGFQLPVKAIFES
ncbi:MAG TPA: Uma2 family endonuclease [Spirillospora sp.]|nr:Uma2 family endonuclease [Spirillospora sp.]